MARILGLALAIVAGTATALLLASGVTAQHDGHTVSCSSVIGSAAVDSSPFAACTDALTRRTELATVTGLLCIAGASISAFAGRPAQTRNHPMNTTASAGANPTR